MLTKPEASSAADLRPESSRRALLAAGLGSMVGFVASALGRPLPAAAANGDALVLGSTSNAATGSTKVTIPTASIDSVWIIANGGSAKGLRATASGQDGVGVLGEATGTSGFGVLAVSDTYIGVAGSGAVDGVLGDSGTGSGVMGTTNTGTGVFGQAGATTGAGTGVKGESNSPDGFGVSGVGNNGGTGVKGDGKVGVFASSTAAGWMGVWGRHFGAGYGVAGDSIGLVGVSGTSNAVDHPATVGKSQGDSTGVMGFSGGTNATLPAARAKTGVFGQATQDSTSRGVLGVAGAGDGVRGEATSGAALRGTASGRAGYGLRASGRVRLEKVSGVATIDASASAVTVTPGTDITAASFVLLTAQSNIGTRSLYYTTNPTADTFTIHMSSSRTSATAIAWLLLN